ncbi:uncharacterized protein ASCRUDRAFT_24970, partial [Ascoidea rubescens DSM 1968]
ASYACHAYCGNLIIAARACAEDGSSDTGPYIENCLCPSDSVSNFKALIDSCLECGWCLWSNYGSFLTAPLAACGNVPTQPTGTEC